MSLACRDKYGGDGIHCLTLDAVKRVVDVNRVLGAARCYRSSAGLLFVPPRKVGNAFRHLLKHLSHLVHLLHYLINLFFVPFTITQCLFHALSVALAIALNVEFHTSAAAHIIRLDSTMRESHTIEIATQIETAVTIDAAHLIFHVFIQYSVAHLIRLLLLLFISCVRVIAML